MADISLIQDVCMDDCDEGVYEQGDSSTGSPVDDDALPPLARVTKYAQSQNYYDRQLVARIVQRLFSTTPPEVLAEELPKIMDVLNDLATKDEVMVIEYMMEQIPHISEEAFKCKSRLERLRDVTSEYLLPMVVRNLGYLDTSINKATQATLLLLLEKEFIAKSQCEVQVCPAILALSRGDQASDINTAVNLMSKIAPLLGQETTERIFLKRFSELCTSDAFYARKACATYIGDFCAVVGSESFEKILLPCYVSMCEDDLWTVRKSSASVIMYVSSVCPSELRRTILTPVFAKLLQDDSRWVRMSAFQTLGPFIATFADPPITFTTYNYERELVFVNKNGDEFSVDSPSVPDVRFCKFLPKQQNVGNSDMYGFGQLPHGMEKEEEYSELDYIYKQPGDEDIKEMVESVKNAVLSYKSLEQEHDVIGDNLEINLNNVISDIKDATSCDNVDSTINEFSEDVSLDKLSITTYEEPTNLEGTSSDSANLEDPPPLPDHDHNVPVEGNDQSTSTSNKLDNIENQVNQSASEDENLQLYNSYNYWYISPDIPVDLDIVKGDAEDGNANLEELYSNLNLDDSKATAISLMRYSAFQDLPIHIEQDIVPEVLISHFMLMTDATFSVTIDTEMAYYCAYSLPAVVMTLGSENWPLLKQTVEYLASNMQYKVRRTVASCLHELAVILGRDIATEHLTPIFEGFIKDLDEVRIEILKHLAYFLRIIKPTKRVTYLPVLQGFLKTESESNWRFRHEFAKQLLLSVGLFKPGECAKHIGLIAESLLYDVAAVRQVAINLMMELLKHISSKPSLTSFILVRLIERFAHSNKWKRRQTFALLCSKLLSTDTLPPDQFASEVMPHLLDLSWDPVANVRLVVAKTVAQNIIPNEYFSNPDSQHLDGLASVIRRLQSDKDRDVRQHAELGVMSVERPESPLPVFEDFAD